MSNDIRRIAINTGGGDAPGLNAVIQAAVCAADARGWEIVGIREGYDGLLFPKDFPDGGLVKLVPDDVEDNRMWLLIGNMKDMRTSWIVVHLHRLSERDKSFTLPSCGLQSGKPSAWPYCAQEGENAKRADAQLALFSCTT